MIIIIRNIDNIQYKVVDAFTGVYFSTASAWHLRLNFLRRLGRSTERTTSSPAYVWNPAPDIAILTVAPRRLCCLWSHCCITNRRCLSKNIALWRTLRDRHRQQCAQCTLWVPTDDAVRGETASLKPKILIDPEWIIGSTKCCRRLALVLWRWVPTSSHRVATTAANLYTPSMSTSCPGATQHQTQTMTSTSSTSPICWWNTLVFCWSGAWMTTVGFPDRARAWCWWIWAWLGGEGGCQAGWREEKEGGFVIVYWLIKSKKPQ